MTSSLLGDMVTILYWQETPNAVSEITRITSFIIYYVSIYFEMFKYETLQQYMYHETLIHNSRFDKTLNNT